MKAITIHQPWASMIAKGYKKFETRSWKTNYRGPIAIHAGKTFNKHAFQYFMDYYSEADSMNENLPTGAVIAIADLVECWQVQWNDGRLIMVTLDGRRKMFDELVGDREGDFGNFSVGRYAWELANVKMLPEPIPAKGQQGLWNWESDEYAGN